MFPSPLICSILLLLNCDVVCCLSCNHTEFPPPASKDDLEVNITELNCSSNNPIVTISITNKVLEYNIFYNCTTRADSIQDVLIDGGRGSQGNKIKTVDRTIPCGSLCSFGGCYTAGFLGSYEDRSISPLVACSVCHEDPTVPYTTTSVSKQLDPTTYTVPATTLASDPTPSTVTTEHPNCMCSCVQSYRGYRCKCSGHQQTNATLQCKRISSECIQTFLNVSHLDDMEGTHCSCSDSNCTSAEMNVLINIPAVTVVAMISSLLLISYLVITCLLIYSTTSRDANRKEMRPNVMDPRINEIDPIDVSTTKYLPRVESISTLLHAIGAIPESPLKNDDVSLSSHNASEYHLSDTEGYILCIDCSCSNNSEMCHYCTVPNKI